MKRVLVISLAGLLAIGLAGCTDNGVTSLATKTDTASTTTEQLSLDDLGGVEAALIATRILAADLAPSVSASVLATDDPDLPPFEARGRGFHGRRSGEEWAIRRGEGSCEVRFENNGSDTPRLHIGGKPCTVEKRDDGSIKLTEPDGNVVTITKPANGSNTGELTVNDVVWKFTWGTDPLLILENTWLGRTLTVEEDENGALSIARPGGPPHPATWNADGEIEGQFAGDGPGFRFRGGRFM